MRKTETFPWDPVDYLETREDMVAYLDAALEDGDARLIAAVLGDIAWAKGMAQITDDGALMGEGGLEFATVLKVTQALGFRLRAADSVVDGTDERVASGVGSPNNRSIFTTGIGDA